MCEVFEIGKKESKANAIKTFMKHDIFGFHRIFGAQNSVRDRKLNKDICAYSAFDFNYFQTISYLITKFSTVHRHKSECDNLLFLSKFQVPQSSKRARHLKTQR